MGLFTRDRKKGLWDIINGMPGDEATRGTPPIFDPNEAQQEYSPASQPSGPPKKGFDWGRAALAFAGGPGVTQMFREKDERAAEQAALDQKQASIQQAQTTAYRALLARNIPAEQAQAMAQDPSIVAGLLKEIYTPQHYGADGGSLYDPISGKSQVMPSERQIGRNVYRIGSDGTEQKVHSEIEPQSVPGVGLYGWDGTKGGIVDPQQTQQGPQPPTGGLTDEQIMALEHGGAGAAASPRTFRPRRLFGRSY